MQTAFSGGHLRDHAHRRGIAVHDTLDATVHAAIALAARRARPS